VSVLPDHSEQLSLNSRIENCTTRAVNNYEEKKQQRVPQSQHSHDIEPQMNYGPKPNGPSNPHYQNQPYEMPAEQNTHTSQGHLNQSQCLPGYHYSQMPNGY